MSSALSRVRWFPILTCSFVAAADYQHFVSAGSSEGDYIGIGFFAVFAVGAFGRWALARDRFYLITCAGAVLSLAVIVLRRADLFDPGHILPYLLFILFCALGTILTHPSKRGGRA